MATDADLINRFEHHTPSSPGVITAHEDTRAACLHLARVVNEIVPESREKSLALTKIEEAMFWANAGIARLQ